MRKLAISLFAAALSFSVFNSVVDAAQVQMVKTDSKVTFKESAQFQGTGKYQKFTCSISGTGNLAGDCLVRNVSNNTVPASLNVGEGYSSPRTASTDVFLNKGQVYRIQAAVDIDNNNGVTVNASINN